MTKNNETGNKVLNYFVQTLNGMAFGLFATLIIGVIIERLGIMFVGTFGWQYLGEQLKTLGTTLQSFKEIGIGIGVAWSLKLTGLRLIVGAVAGGVSSGVVKDPVVAYLCTIGAIELLNLILRKKTPIDIIIIPLLSSVFAFGIALLIGGPVATVMLIIREFIKIATELQPFIMGIIIALVMGMALTAPISSAAIAIAIGLDGIAGGAALAGCCTQMIGFAIMSRKDNDIGTILSIAFGTSMLQFKNILKKPIIWLPPIIVSIIVGPLATMVFKAETTKYGAGMGTSGLVGQIETVNAMGTNLNTFITIGLLHFILPFVLVFIVDILFRKYGLIKQGDLKI